MLPGIATEEDCDFANRRHFGSYLQGGLRAKQQSQQKTVNGET